MNKDEIISKVLSDEKSFTVKSTEELEAMIDKELSKPDNEIDYELVNELTLQAIEEKGQKPLHNDVDEKLKELKSIQSMEKKRFRLPKWSIGLVAACVMLMCANVVSVSAWNMNIFTLIVELTQGGVKIDFNNQKEEEIILHTSDDDPYGIIAKCVEDGITIETPHYLPEGFKLTTCETETPEENKFVVMTFKKGTELISFSFEAALDGPVGIPSDKHNISETTINGHTAIISKEDNQMIAVFKSGDFMFTMFTQDVDYAECDKILNSIR